MGCFMQPICAVRSNTEAKGRRPSWFRTSERCAASLSSVKVLEMVETSLICVYQCSMPRDPSESAKIARAPVCLMCGLQNRVPEASA